MFGMGDVSSTSGYQQAAMHCMLLVWVVVVVARWSPATAKGTGETCSMQLQPLASVYIHNAEDSSMVGTVLPAFNVVRPASPHLGDTLCRFSCQHQWLRISRHMVVLTAVGKRVVCCSCCCTVACMVCWAAGHMGVCVVPCMASHALWSWLPADSCWY